MKNNQTQLLHTLLPANIREKLDKCCLHKTIRLNTMSTEGKQIPDGNRDKYVELIKNKYKDVEFINLLNLDKDKYNNIQGTLLDDKMQQSWFVNLGVQDDVIKIDNTEFCIKLYELIKSENKLNYLDLFLD